MLGGQGGKCVSAYEAYQVLRMRLKYQGFLMRIITHLAGQTYVWHGCKWNFAGPQIYLQPAKIKIQHFGVSLKFLVCN